MKINIKNILEFFSTHENTKKKVPHRSVLCTIVCIIYIYIYIYIYMNDLPMDTNHISDVILYADDTRVLVLCTPSSSLS